MVKNIIIILNKIPLFNTKLEKFTKKCLQMKKNVLLLNYRNMFIKILINIKKEETIMNRKVIKVVSLLLIVLMAVSMLSTSVFADTMTADSINVTTFKDAQDSSGAANSVTNIIGSFITIVRVIGTGVAIIMLIVMAIKYISAAPSEKAEIKKSATIYIVGAVILFAASAILGIIQNFATTNITDSSAYVEIVDINDIYLG